MSIFNTIQAWAVNKKYCHVIYTYFFPFLIMLILYIGHGSQMEISNY